MSSGSATASGSRRALAVSDSNAGRRTSARSIGGSDEQGARPNRCRSRLRGLGSSGRRAPRRPRVGARISEACDWSRPTAASAGCSAGCTSGRRGGSRVRRRAPRSRHQQDEALSQGRRRLPAGLAPRPFGHAADARSAGDPLRPRVVGRRSGPRRLGDPSHPGGATGATHSRCTAAPRWPPRSPTWPGSSRGSRSAPSTSTTTAACAW